MMDSSEPMMRRPFVCLRMEDVGEEKTVMRVASFDAVSNSLNKLDPWLKSLGIEPKSDRWHQAIQMVEKTKKHRESVERDGPRSPMNNYMDGLFEALEIH